jgi:uncharacterized protein YcgL (UPF0745 family)
MPHCLIYRSPKKEETYLFVEVGKPYADLPDGLREMFGEPSLVMKLEIKPGTKLAQAESARVLRAIEEEGYFLQLPPKKSVEELIARKFA